MKEKFSDSDYICIPLGLLLPTPAYYLHATLHSHGGENNLLVRFCYPGGGRVLDFTKMIQDYSSMDEDLRTYAESSASELYTHRDALTLQSYLREYCNVNAAIRKLELPLPQNIIGALDVPTGGDRRQVTFKPVPGAPQLTIPYLACTQRVPDRGPSFPVRKGVALTRQTRILLNKLGTRAKYSTPREIIWEALRRLDESTMPYTKTATPSSEIPEDLLC